MKSVKFHNTNQSSPQLMIVYNADALTGAEAVLEVMHKLKAAAWFQVHACIPWMNESSLKRSLTQLMNEKKLVMETDKGKMVMSPSGKSCHIYKLIKQKHNV